MSILHRIAERERSLGESTVQRLLPVAECRQVGPWIFVDRFGPHTQQYDRSHDVTPHPHCALSTVSFLFEGQIEHRDSTGGHALVKPNEIHWMRAGHGITHSERTPAELIGKTQTRSGLQLWCAHPDGEEEQVPTFNSYRELPELDLEGVRVQLLAGNGWNTSSPVKVTSNLVYAIAHLKAGQTLSLPDHEERCVYAFSGTISVDKTQSTREMLVLSSERTQVLAVSDASVVILGGDRIGKRYFWWNLIHSDKGRLREQAERWQRREFPVIPEDPYDGKLPGPGELPKV